MTSWQRVDFPDLDLLKRDFGVTSRVDWVLQRNHTAHWGATSQEHQERKERENADHSESNVALSGRAADEGMIRRYRYVRTVRLNAWLGTTPYLAGDPEKVSAKRDEEEAEEDAKRIWP